MALKRSADQNKQGEEKGSLARDSGSPGPCSSLLPLTIKKFPVNPRSTRIVLQRFHNARHAAQPRCSPRRHYSSGRSGKVSRQDVTVSLPRMRMRSETDATPPQGPHIVPYVQTPHGLDLGLPRPAMAPFPTIDNRPHFAIANIHQPPVFPSSSPSRANTPLPSARRPAPPPSSPASWA